MYQIAFILEFAVKTPRVDRLTVKVISQLAVRVGNHPLINTHHFIMNAHVSRILIYAPPRKRDRYRQESPVSEILHLQYLRYPAAMNGPNCNHSNYITIYIRAAK